MMDARQDILNKLKKANYKAKVKPIHEAIPSRDLESYSEEELLNLFVQRLKDYGVLVHFCDEVEIKNKINDLVVKQKFKKVVYPPGLDWLKNCLGNRAIVDDTLTSSELDKIDGVITACAFGIAETGSIVLNAEKDQGRRAISLVPDWHLCLVRKNQILANVSQTMKELEASSKQGKAITFISGPSATADIEFQRVQGVHGPRTLEVIIYR